MQDQLDKPAQIQARYGTWCRTVSFILPETNEEVCLVARRGFNSYIRSMSDDGTLPDWSLHWVARNTEIDDLDSMDAYRSKQIKGDLFFAEVLENMRRFEHAMNLPHGPLGDTGQPAVLLGATHYENLLKLQQDAAQDISYYCLPPEQIRENSTVLRALDMPDAKQRQNWREWIVRNWVPGAAFGKQPSFLIAGNADAQNMFYLGTAAVLQTKKDITLQFKDDPKGPFHHLRTKRPHHFSYKNWQRTVWAFRQHPSYVQNEHVPPLLNICDETVTNLDAAAFFLALGDDPNGKWIEIDQKSKEENHHCLLQKCLTKLAKHQDNTDRATLDFLSMLIDSGAELAKYWFDDKVAYLLHAIAEHDHGPLLRQALESGKRHSWPQTILNEGLVAAIRHNRPEMFDILADHGADVHVMRQHYVAGSSTETPVSLSLIADAVVYNRPNFLSILDRHHVPYPTGSDALVLLNIASEIKQLGIFKRLIEKANLSTPQIKRLILQLSEQNNYYCAKEALTFFKNHGGTFTPDEENGLLFAAVGGLRTNGPYDDLCLLNQYLSQGFRPSNSCMWDSIASQIDGFCLTRLLQAGLDANSHNLMVDVVRNGDLWRLRTLVTYGASLGYSDDKLGNLAEIAMYHGHVAIVDYLYKKEVYIDICHTGMPKDPEHRADMARWILKNPVPMEHLCYDTMPDWVHRAASEGKITKKLRSLANVLNAPTGSSGPN